MGAIVATKRMNVCVVTGTRAEFGIWRSVLEGIRASKKLELKLVVTGMHLQREFGYTVRDIEAAGFGIDARVEMYRKGESAADSLARGTRGLARAYREVGAEVVMVLGDRLEMLAAAGAAVAERLAIGHVHGGETAPGTWDEQIRHAVTKMAHVHFCATEKAGERIVRMGEEKGRVHVVGAPGLDGILGQVAALRRTVKREERVLVLLHPSSGDEGMEERRAGAVIRAVRGMKVLMVVVGPNNDPGHGGILRAYERAGVEVTLSLPVVEFWEEMLRCGVMVGNSSSGIIEAGSFGVPVVNVGERQAGRERNGNVIDVGWEAGEIRAGIERAVSDRAFLRKVAAGRNLYGDGRAAERIVRVLEGLGRPVGIMKQFVDR